MESYQIVNFVISELGVRPLNQIKNKQIRPNYYKYYHRCLPCQKKRVHFIPLDGDAVLRMMCECVVETLLVLKT